MPGSHDNLEKVDTLIIGGGPIGLLLAYQLRRFQTTVALIEKDNKSIAPIYGRATTLWCRTLELYDQLELCEPLMDDGCITTDGVNFRHGRPAPGGLSFAQGLHKQGDTRFKFSLHLRQRLIERAFEKALEKYDSTPRHQQTLLSYIVDESKPYPVLSTIRNDVTGETYQILSKYIIGCDGGHSQVRKDAGIKFIGERSGNAWIRIDALVKTDMPSPRTLNSVQSDTHGLVLWCPIDEGKVRIGYVFSQALKEKYGEENVNGEVAMAEAKKALAPFNVEFVKLDWYTLYGIGQNIAEKFVSGRVILAGDSCHTHSSGSAQGLNTGSFDAINLGWKLAMVIKGQGSANLLDTYNTERRFGVNQVIENDKIISTLISGQYPPKYAGRTDSPREILDEWFENAKNVAFTIGLGVGYEIDDYLNQPQPLTPLASVVPGKRAPDCYVSRLGTNERVPVQRLMPNDGAFYVTVFGGIPLVTYEKLANFRAYLDESAGTWVNSFTPGVIKLVTILATGGIAAGESMRGLKSFGKTYYDTTQEAHQSYGVDPAAGALIVHRPDGYIGHVVPLEAPEQLFSYFKAILTPAASQGAKL